MQGGGGPRGALRGVSGAVEETQEYSGGAHAQCLVYTLEGRAEPQLVHSGPLCTANHPVRLFSSKVRGLPYGPWAILGGIELFVFPILEKRDVGSPLRLQPDHLAAAAIASID